MSDIDSCAEAQVRPKVYFVTDPMCSWCWGMAADIDTTVAALGDTFDFDLWLGGINVDAVAPMAEHVRARLESLWRRVTEVTGTTFGDLPPDGFVYNSTLPCAAVRLVGSLTGSAPFAFLHHLQALFFTAGVNVNDTGVLTAAARELGLDEQAFRTVLRDADTRVALTREFETSRCYGTNALPSVVMEAAGERRLVAGGYVAADVLAETLVTFARQSFRRSSPPPV